MAINNKYKFKCIVCEKQCVTNQVSQVLCSDECRTKRYGRYSSGTNISPGTVGAVSELMVAADLMIKGYSVFRALSPSCFCDLIAIKDSEYRKVEVRTGYLSGTGKVTFIRKVNEINGLPNEFAVYVNSEKKVYYFNV